MTHHEIAEIEKLWPKERWPFRKLAMRICNKFIKDFDNQFHKLPYEIMDAMGLIIEIEHALTQVHEEGRKEIEKKCLPYMGHLLTCADKLPHTAGLDICDCGYKEIAQRIRELK